MQTCYLVGFNDPRLLSRPTYILPINQSAYSNDVQRSIWGGVIRNIIPFFLVVCALIGPIREFSGNQRWELGLKIHERLDATVHFPLKRNRKE